MTFVLDASIALSWYFEDETTEKSIIVLRRLSREEALVPGHWWFEIRNVVLIGERRKRSTEAQTEPYLRRLSSMAIRIRPLPDGAAVLALARRHRLTFFDSAYLELAVREKCPLATFDNALRAAAEAEAVPLL